MFTDTPANRARERQSHFPFPEAAGGRAAQTTRSVTSLRVATQQESSEQLGHVQIPSKVSNRSSPQANFKNNFIMLK